MLNGFNNSSGVTSVATAALQVALVQQNQFEKVLEESVDRKHEEAEKLRKAAKAVEPIKDEVVIDEVSVDELTPVTAAPAEAATSAPGESVDIEV